MEITPRILRSSRLIALCVLMGMACLAACNSAPSTTEDRRVEIARQQHLHKELQAQKAELEKLKLKKEKEETKEAEVNLLLKERDRLKAKLETVTKEALDALKAKMAEQMREGAHQKATKR